MVSDRRSGGSRREEPEIPNLYPDLDPLEMEQFLSDRAYALIKSFDNVYILPFMSEDSEPKQACFGFGLSRLMIRNLMLLRNISIHGPEDTAEVPCQGIEQVIEAHPRSAHLTGVAETGPDGYTLKAEYHHPRRPVRRTRVREENFRKFLRECSYALTELMGSKVGEAAEKAWEVAQPRDASSLIRLGRIHRDFERRQLAERGRAALRLLDDDPDFIVAMWDIDEELPGARQHYFEGLERDPYNAQLCFLTFCTVWKSRGPQPEALQFCRRAIALSPGHGKAHMCAPHAAQRPADLLRHSELGYRLLPGNSFAVNNYTLALARANAPAEKRIELAEEGIETDPRDPSNYDRLIELYTNLGDYRNALAVAKRLQKLYEPIMNERTLYCLRQNPERARRLAAGEWDPAAENRKRIAELRRRAEEEEGRS